MKGFREKKRGQISQQDNRRCNGGEADSEGDGMKEKPTASKTMKYRKEYEEGTQTESKLVKEARRRHEGRRRGHQGWTGKGRDAQGEMSVEGMKTSSKRTIVDIRHGKRWRMHTLTAHATGASRSSDCALTTLRQYSHHGDSMGIWTFTVGARADA